MKYVYLALVFAVALVVGWAGVRGTPFKQPPREIFPDMDRQPKYKPQSPSAFFADNLTDRRPPARTVARGIGYTSQAELPVWRGGDALLLTGKGPDGAFSDAFPLPITETLMARGRNRYEIYCAPCHGALGDARGTVAQYGWAAIANLTQAPYTQRLNGDLFHTITFGKNTMLPYGDKLAPEDRWAVVLYVRALQRAANARPGDVPEAERARLGL